MTRVFVDAELISGGITELPRDTGAHLAKVLRARVGDEFVLFNGDGCEFGATIETIRGARVSAAIGASRIVDRESPVAITLVQCVPRGDRMDFIVQKAVELGVSRIVPVLSRRSVVRLDISQVDSKQAHWQAVAVSACEQCGRNRVPSIDIAQPLLNYLGSLQPGSSLRLVLEPAGRPPARPATQDTAVVGVIAAVGPEGGFAEEELEAFELSHFKRLRLGPRILRTETAAIAAIAWLQSRYGDLSEDS